MSSPIELRSYQVDAVERVRAHFRGGGRTPLIVAPTGAGKTVIGAYLMKAAGDKGTRTSFLVDRVNLVDQTSAMFDRYGIDHGVVQAGHWRRRDTEKLQVCSVQTLEKRGFFPDTALLINDEAHCMRKQTTELITKATTMKVVGLTATPFAEGMGKLYDGLINVTTTNRLIEDGFLVPLQIYAAVKPDMTGAKVVAGEWTDSEIQARGHAILGDIVSEWIDKTKHHFGGPVKTIVFSASVAHGAELCEAFNAAGYNFQQLSYEDRNDEERREKIAEFRKADSAITGLVACEVLTKGFDVPDVMCGVAARPYRKSFSSHIQQLGRVMRPFSGKEFALWLDHSGNIMRFLGDQQDLFANGVKSLDIESPDKKTRNPKEEGENEKALKCSQCGYVMPPRAPRCPACGHARPRMSAHESGDGAMVLINGKEVPASGKHAYLADRALVWRQLAFIALRKKPNDLAGAQRFAQANYREFYGEFAHARIENTALKEPCAELLGYMHHKTIKFAKAAMKREAK